MSLIVVGVNHRTVPLSLLERMTVSPAHLSKALGDLSGREHIIEVVLLSTCNRTEIYARCTRFHAAVGDVRDFLAAHSGADADDLSDHLYTYFDDAAVSHLFTVAAGLDSMIVGEGEILGQVREAWKVAETEGTTSGALARAFRHAVAAGKKVRTETEIGRQPASVASAAVAVASERLGGLEGRRVLVVGAGEMGEGLALAARNRGAADICVANRTADRARRLALSLGGRAVPLARLADELAEADLLLTSTGSDEVLLERHTVEPLMSWREERPLLVVDVAMPRDVDPGVGEVVGVDLLDLDDLRGYAATFAEQHRRSTARAREIVGDELEKFRRDHREREIAPVITALRSAAEQVRREEHERFEARFSGLDAATRESIEMLTRRIVKKLLHEPTVRVKDAAGTDRGEMFADALATLFDLPERER